MSPSINKKSARLWIAAFGSDANHHARWLADSGDDLTIWYLGSDYARLLALQQKTKARFAPVADAVNASAHALLPLFLDLDGALAGPKFDRDAWNASDLAERSRFNSPFFLETARIVALLNSAAEGRHLVVTDDEAFALCVFDTAAANGFEVKWSGRPRGVARARNCAFSTILAAKRTLGEVRGALRRMRALRRLRKENPLSRDAVRAVDVWIVIWATGKTFAPNVPLEREDRAGRLPGLLRSGGLRVGYIVLPLWPEHFEAIAINALSCPEPILLVEDGSKLTDIAAACIASLYPLPGVKRTLAWNGLDLTSLLRRAFVHERETGRPIKVRWLRLIPKLLRNMGAQPKSVVTTYENHSWEKVLTVAVHRNLPGTRVVGHNHALVSPFYLSMNPSPGDAAANSIPDCVMTLGDLTAEGLAARGFPRDRLVAVGGLRYEDFFESAAEIGPASTSQTKTVLCCVGVDLDEGVELVRKGAEAVHGVDGFALLVNFHPMSGSAFRETLRASLRAHGTSGFQSIRFDDRAVRDLLGETHAVLYIDSNAALEAAAAGRQIIYVMRETGIDYDKMPAGLARHCRTAGEIRQALLDEKQISPVDAKQILARAIAPVDAGKILSVVQGASQ